MLISLLFLIATSVYKNSVRNSKDKSVKDTATRLVIAASILFVIELVFLVLSVFYQHSYSTITLLFPIFAFFHQLKLNRGYSSMSGQYVGKRLDYFQPNLRVDIGGTAPVKQT